MWETLKLAGNPSFIFLPRALQNCWDLTAQTFRQQQGRRLFAPQQFPTISHEHGKKSMCFLLLYHFSVQQSQVLPENVKAMPFFLINDYYGKLWEIKTAVQVRTSMPSYQKCFQSNTENQILLLVESLNLQEHSC